MEPGGSIQHSQGLSNNPYPEPNQPNVNPMSWLMLTRFSFCPSISKRRTNFALTQCIWSISVKIAWEDPTLMPTSSVNSRTVKWWFPWITSWTLSTWRSSVDVEGRPGLGSSLNDVLPSLKHLNHCVRLMHSSPYACFSNSNVFRNVSPSLKKNFTHTRVVPQAVP